MLVTGFPIVLLALLIGVATGSITALSIWLLAGSQLSLWLGALLAGVVATGSSLTLLYFIVYRRLHAIYENMLRIQEHRLPDVPIQRQPDPLAGINRTMLMLSGEMRQQITELREIELIRREFLGDVSHELKTPIFAIQGFLETLLDGAMDDPSVNRKFLQQALNNAFRLNALVQDLLVVTSLEAGELSINREPVRIYELLLDVMGNLQQKARQANHKVTLSVKANDNEKLYVLVDKERIRQVLNNLIDNAIKYGRTTDAATGQPGSSTVEVVLRRHNGSLQVQVCDEGPGIPEADQPHIFQRFYRVDKSRSRSLGGTGLGLSIVKNLLAAHGTDISVESRPGRTVFSFGLEVAPG